MKKIAPLLIAFLFVFPSFSSAYWVWSPEAGKFVNPEGGAAGDAAEEEYNYAMRFLKDKNYKDAIQHLEDLLKEYPTSAVAPEAQYRLGTVYEEQGDYLKAHETYQRLVKTYPQSDRFAEVIEREFRIGNLFLSGQKARFFGFEVLPALVKAAEIFGQIVENAPYGEFGDQAQFHKGLALKKAGRFNEASEAFQGVIDQYPQSELVPKARFQLAETSYDRSANQYRDQRALDDASKNVDRFLERYPSSEATEKAAKLRQIIDEKNAEKNYRVGLYYEKQNYLKSALIYYEDVSLRYPQTKWGQKALERLKALEQPAEYLSGREKNLAEQKKELEAQLKLLDKNDKVERPELEARWKKLDDQEKSLEEEKEDSLKRRQEDLKRRERELNQRFKNLEKKRKLAEDNPSEDFHRAMDRWHSALISEKDELIREREQLEKWYDSLGVSSGKDFMEMIPFMGPAPTEIEKVRQIDAKKLYKVSEEKRNVFDEKELLYKQLDEVSSLLQATEVQQLGLERKDSHWLENIQVDERLVSEQKKLKGIRQNIESLEKSLEAKKASYQSEYGQSPFLAVLSAPVKLVSASSNVIAKSFSKINPFDGSDHKLEGKSDQELSELRMHLREREAAQQSIVETLQGAFNAELALQKQQRLMQELGEDGAAPDPHALRKKVKTLEKNIRANYQEIDDRDKNKKQLLKDLNNLVKEKEASDDTLSRSARAIAAPAVITGKAFKAFIFGSPDEGVEIAENAERVSENSPASGRIVDLKGEIELQNLMIQAKNEEIRQLEKELKILKAKASFAGGYKFRSAFVDVPYQFLEGAIDSAKKMIPTKDREEVLIARLNDETRELESLRAELKSVESRIGNKTDRVVSSEAKPNTSEDLLKKIAVEKENAEIKAQSKMRNEITGLVDEIKTKEYAYQTQKEILEKELKSEKKNTREAKAQQKVETKQKKELTKQQQELEDKLEKAKEDIVKLIEKEKDLEMEESEILEKRITHIDKAMQAIKSKATSQDLLHERERIESRLSQIELRRDFLANEVERFNMNERALRA